MKRFPDILTAHGNITSFPVGPQSRLSAANFLKIPVRYNRSYMKGLPLNQDGGLRGCDRERGKHEFILSYLASVSPFDEI